MATRLEFTVTKDERGGTGILYAGNVIDGVAVGSTAQAAGLLRGDIIHEIAGMAVATENGVAAALAAAPKRFVVGVYRGGAGAAAPSSLLGSPGHGFRNRRSMSVNVAAMHPHHDPPEPVRKQTRPQASYGSPVAQSMQPSRLSLSRPSNLQLSAAGLGSPPSARRASAFASPPPGMQAFGDGSPTGGSPTTLLGGRAGQPPGFRAFSDDESLSVSPPPGSPPSPLPGITVTSSYGPASPTTGAHTQQVLAPVPAFSVEIEPPSAEASPRASRAGAGMFQSAGNAAARGGGGGHSSTQASSSVGKSLTEVAARLGAGGAPRRSRSVGAWGPGGGAGGGDVQIAPSRAARKGSYFAAQDFVALPSNHHRPRVSIAAPVPMSRKSSLGGQSVRSHHSFKSTRSASGAGFGGDDDGGFPGAGYQFPAGSPSGSYRSLSGSPVPDLQHPEEIILRYPDVDVVLPPTADVAPILGGRGLPAAGARRGKKKRSHRHARQPQYKVGGGGGKDDDRDKQKKREDGDGDGKEAGGSDGAQSKGSQDDGDETQSMSSDDVSDDADLNSEERTLRRRLRAAARARQRELAKLPPVNIATLLPPVVKAPKDRPAFRRGVTTLYYFEDVLSIVKHTPRPVLGRPKKLRALLVTLKRMFLCHPQSAKVHMDVQVKYIKGLVVIGESQLGVLIDRGNPALLNNDYLIDFRHYQLRARFIDVVRKVYTANFGTVRYVKVYRLGQGSKVKDALRLHNSEVYNYLDHLHEVLWDSSDADSDSSSDVIIHGTPPGGYRAYTSSPEGITMPLAQAMGGDGRRARACGYGTSDPDEPPPAVDHRGRLKPDAGGAVEKKSRADEKKGRGLFGRIVERMCSRSPSPVRDRKRDRVQEEGTPTLPHGPYPVQQQQQQQHPRGVLKKRPINDFARAQQLQLQPVTACDSNLTGVGDVGETSYDTIGTTRWCESNAGSFEGGAVAAFTTSGAAGDGSGDAVFLEHTRPLQLQQQPSGLMPPEAAEIAAGYDTATTAVSCGEAAQYAGGGGARAHYFDDYDDLLDHCKELEGTLRDLRTEVHGMKTAYDGFNKAEALRQGLEADRTRGLQQQVLILQQQVAALQSENSSLRIHAAQHAAPLPSTLLSRHAAWNATRQAAQAGYQYQSFQAREREFDTELAGKE